MARVRAAATRSTSPLAIRPYPKELEESIELAGQRLTLRPIRGEDSAEHDAFMGGIDPEDLRLRFGREVRHLSRSELARMTRIDYEREMAFIATVAREEGRSETVGEVRMSAEPDGARAEFTIVVRSDFQRKGLGHALAEKMLRYCRGRGVGLLYGLVDASNARMLGLAQRLGFEIERSPDGRTAVISLDLQRRPDSPRVKLFYEMAVGAGSSERQRLAFLVERDGAEAAAEWARRTMIIYRRSLLAPGHFARTAEYRRRFVEAYCEFKRWLARAPGS